MTAVIVPSHAKADGSNMAKAAEVESDVWECLRRVNCACAGEYSDARRCKQRTVAMRSRSQICR